MKKTIFVILLGLAVTFVLGAATVWSQPGRGGDGMGPGMMGGYGSGNGMGRGYGRQSQ